MKSLLSLIPLLVMPAIAQPATCTLSSRVLAPYREDGRANPVEWRNSREELWQLMNCPMGPADAVSRHRFFDVISAEFQYPYQPKFEGESESITQFQHELQRYMDRIVDDRDIEYRSTILRYANGKAISALGPAVLSDVEQMAQTSLPVVGFSRHQPQRAALQALGYWIDPSETRFTPVEKSDMTNILVDRLAVYAADTPHHSDALASAIVDALSHSDSRKAEAALRHWASDPSVSTTFRDVALAAGRAVEKRIQQ